MNTDVATLQNIADTLKEDPLASQRVLAENAGMSIGLMNAVIKRFVERGWIMLTNVNLRKLSYAITPAGIAELTARSQNFAKRTFAIANKYNETFCQAVSDAKKQGKNKLVLYGSSYIKFLLVYACQTYDVTFLEKTVDEPIEKGAFCLVGEQCEEEDVARLTGQGGVSLLDLLGE
ncbi:winged helix-turn-helix transcriptional regulator [uncultured Treponema sp.]|uniref:winged helix-turn-helix transcriptional regulator n=1 Tax=uncultured Treponema sp. TaxID=162155 RepID=UPI0025ED9775|nr:winged helix-turn-helix transcriptional regulator [uncultured Treponema sp.]